MEGSRASGATIDGVMTVDPFTVQPPG